MTERPEYTGAEVIDRTRTWVRNSFLYMRPDWPLEDETPLLKTGVIDSIGVIELVCFLEDTFHCTIPEPDITEENLGTLGRIARYVTTRAPSTLAAAAGISAPGMPLEV